MTSIFKNFKARCSSLGNLMTCLPEPITGEELQELNDLQSEKETGRNANGRATKWTDTKQAKLQRLLRVKEGKDELPAGCITHLEDIFRSQYWNRKRLLHNKYLGKGNFGEQDALALLSYLDKEFYIKNDEHLNNAWLQGTPDYIGPDMVIDTKCSWDMDTFDKSELTKIYEWQLKGYMMLTKKKKGVLAYCLVNSPLHIIDAEKKSLWFAMGQPDYTEERWIEAASQLEINHIFDITAFKSENPGYDLITPVWNFDIHPVMRVKRFEVVLTPEDKKHVTRRVKMARKWLMDKEKEVNGKLKSAA